MEMDGERKREGEIKRETEFPVFSQLRAKSLGFIAEGGPIVEIKGPRKS